MRTFYATLATIACVQPSLEILPTLAVATALALRTGEKYRQRLWREPVAPDKLCSIDQLELKPQHSV